MSLEKENHKSDLLRLSLILFGITAAVALLLALANYVTSPIIQKSAEKRLNRSLAIVMPDAVDFESINFIAEHVSVGETSVPVVAVYSGLSKDEVNLGYCVHVAPAGYSDKIEMIVAVDNECTVRGVRVLSINDTPGVGMKVQSDEEFRNKVLGLTDSATPVKTTPKNNGEIQVISGATISSKAYIYGVNAAIEVVRELEQEASTQ